MSHLLWGLALGGDAGERAMEQARDMVALAKIQDQESCGDQNCRCRCLDGRRTGPHPCGCDCQPEE